MNKLKKNAVWVIPLIIFCIAFIGLTISMRSSLLGAKEVRNTNIGNPTILTIHVRKGPYLIYPGHQDQMTVLWQVDSTITCTLEWGTGSTYSSGSAQTLEYGIDHQHKYTITGLVPQTKYLYRVIVDNQAHSGSFFSAPDSTATTLKFLAYGDTRSYPGTHDQVANAIMSTQDSAFQTIIVSGGDLVNTGTNEADWDSQFFNAAYPHIQNMLASLPYQCSMGNHEGTGTLFVKYFPYPFVGSRYWSFDYGPAHFAIVDQYTSYTPGSAQLRWLQNDLSSSTKRWKFIVLHEPGWTAGGDHQNNVNVQNYIQPLCLQYGVSIVFGGHNHYYARAVVNGVEHITTGGGGAPLYQPNPGYPNIVASNMTNHFCTIEINGSRLNFKAINILGAVIDSFSLGSQGH